MRVPVRRLPNTRVSEQQQGYAQTGPGLNVSSITQALSSGVDVVQGLRKQLEDEQLDRQKFEANKRLMKEINELQSDFEERRRDPEISPIDFADTTEAAYQERHRVILEELQTEGFEREVIEDLDLRLGSVRQGFYERGLGHQLVELKSRAFNEVEELGVSASQYVAKNPDDYASARDMIRESVSSLPDLTEAEREAKIDEQLGILRDAGAKAMAIQRPQEIIDLFDPQGLTAPARVRTTTSSGTVTAPVGSWQSVATTVADALDLDPVEVAAVISYETAGTFSSTIKGGKNNSHLGLIQFGREERRKYGITETSTPEQWTTAILSYMQDRGFKKGMSLLDFYSTINAGSPGRYNASDGPGNTVRGHVDKLLSEHKGKAQAWLGVGTSNDPVQLVDVPPSTSPQSEVVEGTSLAPQISPDAKTGNPLLDDLNGPERLQLLGWAREQLSKVNASRKAEMDVTIGNITAEALNNGGEIATPLPSQADVLAVYGPVEGPQRWAQIQQSKDTGKAITTFRTRSATDIQLGLEAIKPRPGSPTYETELQIYQAAERAAQHLLKEREDDPAAYALKYFPSVGAAAKKSLPNYYAELDRVYESLGIDSSRAPLLTGDAARQITQDYKLMSPTDKLAFMRENFGGMGEDRFRRFVSNMEGTTAQDDARIFALLRTYPGGKTEWSTVYQQVLEGREMIAQDPAKRPPADLLNQAFRKSMGIIDDRSGINHLDSNASRAIQEATAALYVLNGGNPKTLDQSLYNESLKTALGGSLPVNMRKGQVKDYTILPPKVSRNAFQNWIERQTFETLTYMSVDQRPPRYGDLKTLVQTEDIIDEGVFVMVSPGRYMIKMASDGRPIVTSTGRPFLVDVGVREVAARPIPNKLWFQE